MSTFLKLLLKLLSDIRLQALSILLFSILMLSACVTETTNPVFNVEPSEEEALANYLQLAIGYLDEDDLPSAKRHLGNAAEIDPNNSEIFAIWGLIYTREGELTLADENFRQALRMDSDNSQARNNYAAFLFARGRIEDAYDQLEQVVTDTEYQQRPQAFENLGVAAMQLGRLEDAEEAFSRARQLNPNQLRSVLELAVINLGRDNVTQARTFWQNYLTLIQFYNLGHNPRSLLIGAQIEQASENNERARQYGELLRSTFPASAEYQSYLELISN